MLDNVLSSTRDHDRPEVIVSAALYLMSAYGRNGGCPRLAHMILRHLELIAGNQEVSPLLRGTCAQLVEQWERVLERALPAGQAGQANLVSHDNDSHDNDSHDSHDSQSENTAPRRPRLVH